MSLKRTNGSRPTTSGFRRATGLLPRLRTHMEAFSAAELSRMFRPDRLALRADHEAAGPVRRSASSRDRRTRRRPCRPTRRSGPADYHANGVVAADACRRAAAPARRAAKSAWTEHAGAAVGAWLYGWARQAILTDAGVVRCQECAGRRSPSVHLQTSLPVPEAVSGENRKSRNRKVKPPTYQTASPRQFSRRPGESWRRR